MKIKTKLKACFVCILSVATGTYAGIATKSEVVATNPQTITFNVNVVESLSVTLTQSNLTQNVPVNTMKTNYFELSVNTNNASGYTASMRSATTSNNLNNGVYTSLVNGSAYIPTLSAGVTRSNFPTNQWGYSLNDTTAGDNSATYSPMRSDAQIWIGNNSDSGAKKVFFGTKVDASKASGSYTNDVVVSVVSGVSTSNTGTPTVPANPAPSLPTYDNPSDSAATLPNGGSGSYTNPSPNTVYTSGDTTKIISGSYSGPLGVSEGTYTTTSNVTGESSLATGLAVASATAAISGGLFFALAKLRNRDDDNY